MRLFYPIPLCLMSCAPVSHSDDAATSLPLFGQGYRADGDICRRVGENADTNPFLDDAADLVACPEGAESLGAFVADTGAVEVARRDGFILYSVPLR